MKKNRFLFLLAASQLFLASCYVASQAGPYLSQRVNAVPVEDLLARDDLDDDVRTMLVEVRRIRGFSRDVLGLKQSKNYEDVVFIDRDYLAAVIQAAPEFSTDPYLFWYPFLGRLPYRGYYDPDKAKKYGRRLEKKGLDVFIRKVDAFSSLGFFKDPLYSFMANYSTRRLAELIIHEETHATVFFKKYPDFNEKLATVIGEAGAQMYVDAYGVEENSPEDSGGTQAGRDAFRKALFELASELDGLYESDIPIALMRERKKEFLETFQSEWQLSFPVNNAFVSLYKIYEEPDNRVAEAFDNAGSIASFISLLQKAEARGDNPWTVISDSKQFR